VSLSNVNTDDADSSIVVSLPTCVTADAVGEGEEFPDCSTEGTIAMTIDEGHDNHLIKLVISLHL